MLNFLFKLFCISQFPNEGIQKYLQSYKAKKKKNDVRILAQTRPPQGSPQRKKPLFKATGHRLTTEGDDVAAVFVDKLPCDGLLHDLLHLEGSGSWRGDPNATWGADTPGAFPGCLVNFDNCFPFIPYAPCLL